MTSFSVSHYNQGIKNHPEGMPSLFSCRKCGHSIHRKGKCKNYDAFGICVCGKTPKESAE